MMNLSFEPVHHRKVKSHTGYVWEPVSKASSPEVAAECDKLVREGCMVICHATTPPGVAKWPWCRGSRGLAGTARRVPGAPR